MLNPAQARALAKTIAHLKALRDSNAVDDLIDWFEHTDPSAWDVDVMTGHLKALEAAGCHGRRTKDKLAPGDS